MDLDDITFDNVDLENYKEEIDEIKGQYNELIKDEKIQKLLQSKYIADDLYNDEINGMYEQTKDWGRCEFVTAMVNCRQKIDELEDELKWWKQHCDDIEMENGCDEDY